MERESSMDPETDGTPSPETPPGNTIRLSYRSEYGPRIIDIEKDPMEQRARLLDAMRILESTREKEGNLEYQNAKRQFSMMIEAMQQNPQEVEGKRADDSEYRYNLAKRAAELVAEYEARVAFHQIFLGYEGAGDMGVVKGAVDQFKDKWFDRYFKNSEYRAFRYALQYYVNNGQNFVGMNSLDHIEKVRNEVQKRGDSENVAKLNDLLGRLKTQEDFRKLAIEEVKKVYQEKGLPVPSESELEVMRNLAERFWNISGKRMAQVQTYYDPTKKEKLPDGTEKEVGGYDWVDKAISGGNFQVRNVERFKDRIITRKEALRPRMDVFDELDSLPEVSLDSIDFITFMGKTIKQNQYPGAYTDSKLDFTNDNFWENYNFYNFSNGVDTMFFWSYRYLLMPDGAKKEFEAYITDPSDKNFLEAAKKFEYLTDDKFQTFINLIHHRVKFLETDEARRLGLEKPSKAGFDIMIENWGRELKLRPEEQKYLAQKFLGSDAWSDMTLFWSHIKGNRALLTIFWEILIGILKEGAKPT